MPAAPSPDGERGRLAPLFAPIDISILVWARVGFGLIMAWEVFRYWRNLWIDYWYVAPPFHFTYYGFSWVQPWPEWGMYAHFAALFVLALMVAAGLFYRVASALLAVGWAYVFLLDQGVYLNHLYLVCLLAAFLPFLPAERAFSLDARRRPGIRTDWAPAWTLWLLRAQVGIVYFFGGVAKINEDWLFHAEPLVSWMEWDRHRPWIGEWLAWDGTAWFMSYSGLFIDLLAVPLLLWRFSRPYMLLVLVAFHTLNVFLFKIGIFPFLMVALTLLFLDADWPRRVVARFRELPEREDAPPAPAVLSQRQTLGMAVIGVYLAIQVLMPLRQHLYPGHSMWTGEGWRFAWNMMLRQVDTELEVVAVDRTTGQRWSVNPKDLLTEGQLAKMRENPDMMVQFAHHVAERMASRGHSDVMVGISARTAMNGRPRQHRLDPGVDYSKVERRLWPPVDWIVPREDRPDGS